MIDEQLVAAGLLHVDDAGQERAGGRDDLPSRLEDDGETRLADDREDGIGVLLRRGHARSVVRHAEAAPEIEVLDAGALAGELARQPDQRARGAGQRIEIGDLRADVRVQPHHLDAANPRAWAHNALMSPSGDAELVGLEPGRDVRMRLRRRRRG